MLRRGQETRRLARATAAALAQPSASRLLKLAAGRLALRAFRPRQALLRKEIFGPKRVLAAARGYRVAGTGRTAASKGTCAATSAAPGNPSSSNTRKRLEARRQRANHKHGRQRVRYPRHRARPRQHGQQAGVPSLEKRRRGRALVDFNAYAAALAYRSCHVCGFPVPPAYPDGIARLLAAMAFPVFTARSRNVGS